MWETFRQLLLSPGFWSALVYLVLGAIGGAIISVRYSLAARRPKLIVHGSGAGGDKNRHTWRVSISNFPSFLGQRLDGETAREVYANIRLKEGKSQIYEIYWRGRERKTTLEPGKSNSLELFHWKKNEDGYFIIDSSGEPVAKFQDRDHKFILTLRDRLSRKTEFRFSVEFDDTHLKKIPRLQIVYPFTIRKRLKLAADGIDVFWEAFRLR